MLTSFEVGSVFMIEDRASGVLAEMANQFARLDELARSVQASLTALGENTFGGMSAGIDRVATAMTGLQDSARTLGEGMAGSLDSVVTAAGRSVESIDTITAAFDRAAVAAGRYRDAAGAGGMSPPAPPREDEPIGGSRGRRRQQGGGLANDNFEEDLDGWNARSRFDHPNARAENANIDQIALNQRRGAEYENRDRDRAADQVRREAEDENARRDASYAQMRRSADDDNGEFDRGRDRQRRQAEYENERYDRAERQRVREARPDEPFERAGEASGAGYVGGRASGGGRGHGGGILSGMAPLVEAAGVYGSEKSAMQEDLSITMALQEMGFNPTSPEFPALMDKLRNKIREGTEGTIFSEAKGAGVVPGTAGQLGAIFKTPQERLNAYEGVLPTAMRFAEVSEMYGRGSLQESLKAAVGYSHMTGRYEGEPLEHGLDQMFAIALATGDTIASEQNTLKYSVPIGRAAGMDPDDTAALTGFFQMMGFSGSTAGTGLGQMIMGLTQTGGPLASHLTESDSRREREFSKALHLDPKALHQVAHSRGNQHVQAMKDLGLFDDSGHIKADVAPGGHLNADALIGHIEHYLTNTDPMTGLGTLRNAFTVRGSREAALMNDPAIIERLKNFMENVRHPQSVVNMQQELATRPLQQFEQMLANVANIGNTLASKTLPGVNEALGFFNGILRTTNKFFRDPDNSTVTTAAGYGLEGGLALGAFGLLNRIRRGIWGTAKSGLNFVGGEAESLTMGGPLGATTAGGLTGAVGAAGTGILAEFFSNQILQHASDTIANKVFGPGTTDKWRQDEDRIKREFQEHPDIVRGPHVGLFGNAAPAVSPAPPHAMSPADAAAAAAGRAPPAHAAPANITVQVHNIMNGVADEGTFTHLLTKLTDALKSALSHASGDGHGSDNSIYVGGGP